MAADSCGPAAASAKAARAADAGMLTAAMVLGLALLAAAPGRAVAGGGEACRDQAGIAEPAAGIPDGLLLAIGRRESGRFDPQTGAVLPWPWAVNREGAGHIFESRNEAVAYVAAAQREGSRSIDVGCFQINLKYHPTAFASLDDAFDPAANAAYAARFLRELFDREGSWETAVAAYHSATPLLGVPYREAVFATWHGTAEVARQFRSPPSAAVRVVMGIHIWTAGAASFVPAVEAAFVPPGSARFVRGLPRVITPSATSARIHAGGR